MCTLHFALVFACCLGGLRLRFLGCLVTLLLVGLLVGVVVVVIVGAVHKQTE